MIVTYRLPGSGGSGSHKKPIQQLCARHKDRRTRTRAREIPGNTDDLAARATPLEAIELDLVLFIKPGWVRTGVLLDVLPRCLDDGV